MLKKLQNQRFLMSDMGINKELNFRIEIKQRMRISRTFSSLLGNDLMGFACRIKPVFFPNVVRSTLVFIRSHPWHYAKNNSFIRMIRCLK